MSSNISLLKDNLRMILLNVSIKRLNDILKEYYSYFDCIKITNDFIFVYNDSYYINYNVLESNTYVKCNYDCVIELINDFINSLYDINDIQFLYCDIINKNDKKYLPL